MAGLDPAIRDFPSDMQDKTWMTGPKPAMTISAGANTKG